MISVKGTGGGSEKVTIDGVKVKEKLDLTSYTGENPLTLGQEGYSFPAKTLLKEGLEIINGVSGEDLTDTAAALTSATDALMAMVGRKVADHKGEGEYVWKKQSTHTVTLTQTTQSVKPTVFKVTGKGIDVSDINNLIGLTFNDDLGHALTISSATSLVHLSSTGTETTYTFNWDSSTQTLSFDVAWGSIHVFEEVTVPAESYVVSMDEFSYPNGGELDGDLYTKFDPTTAIAKNIRNGVSIFDIVGTMAEGKTGVDMGSFTPSANTYTIEFSHDLGAKPQYLCIWTKTSVGNDYYVGALTIPTGYSSTHGQIMDGNFGASSDNILTTTTEGAEGVYLHKTKVVCNTAGESLQFKKGVKYRWCVLSS